ncbi:uncharacterized protein [Periplaneta americana]|uniref:uncharacterized protein n=1 Tax=Periplaneta americana TaxID=6978 RepID=UPI0037E884C3
MQKSALIIGVAVLLVVATTRATPKLHPSYPYTPTAGTPDHYNEVQYDYRYAVDDPKSGVINDRWEQRYGEYVKGAYSVLDPDGRVRTVDYEVDGPKGFHAVIRTQFPRNSLLSYLQLQKSIKQHGDPPVNILTNQGIATASSEFNNQRSARLHKDLPVNFHSINPNYYLSLVPGQRTNYRSQKNPATGAFVAASPDRDSVPVPPSPPRYAARQTDAAQVRPVNGYPQPSQYILPPPAPRSQRSQAVSATPPTPSAHFTRTYYGG